jgi:site-specific DNA-methyltransferase (cytosine-N4-specific)
MANGPVLDPFCGSGTTLVETLRRGLPSVGVDINPIACLISRVKTTPWRLTEDRDLLAHHTTELIRHASSGENDIGLFDAIPRVNHWFEPWAQQLLAGAVNYVRKIPESDPWRDRVALAISASTVRISRQESDTRYAAIDKPINTVAALQTLNNALVRIGTWCEEHHKVINASSATVMQGNAQSLKDIGNATIAAAVFSPPYPNAYEYWLYHKYRMYWLGLDPISVRGAEIGARPFYSGSGTATKEDFESQMREVFQELHRVLASGGAALVIVGDSIIRGEFVNNSKILINAADSAAFELLGSRFRNIRKTSSSFNRQHARARKGEHVLLFSRKD